ncbi:MAG: HEAT repeat domain-containing protein [Myxococcota bacterium]
MSVPVYAAEEVSPLLLELARAYRARRHYSRGEEPLRHALGHTARIWKGALGRGTLRLEVRGGLLALPGGPVIRGPGIDELGRELARRGVLRLAFTPDLGEDGIEALIEALCDSGAEGAALETFARRVGQTGGLGITLESRPAAPTRDTPPPVSSQTGERAAPAPPGERRPERPASGPHREPGIDSPDELPDDDLFDLTFSGFEPPRPLTSSSADPSSPSELVQRLQELEACSDPALYASGVARVAESAEKLIHRGQPGMAYDALVVLAQDASNRSRAPSMREAARERVRRLLSNDVLLQVVLEQMATDSAVANVKAAEILLLCGRGVVCELLDAHGRATTATRERINAALVAMGDVAFPVLVEELSSSQPLRVRRAARILGDMQHPRGVEFLVAHLRDAERSVCKEAAMALTRIGTRRAIDGLLEVLGGSDDERAQIAAAALGATRSDRAGKALTAIAESGSRRSDPLRREAIRSLGRMQWSQAVPVLERLLRKRGLLGRKRRRELGMAALHALRRIGGEAAFCALQDASVRGDATLRRHCAEALRLMGRMSTGGDSRDRAA